MVSVWWCLLSIRMCTACVWFCHVTVFWSEAVLKCVCVCVSVCVVCMCCVCVCDCPYTCALFRHVTKVINHGVYTFTGRLGSSCNWYAMVVLLFLWLSRFQWLVRCVGHFPFRCEVWFLLEMLNSDFVHLYRKACCLKSDWSWGGKRW